jgi:GT2 family glycosyltransferase
MSSPSISVIICVYTEDRWDHICAAVESIRAQSRPSAELILVVDHNEALYARLVDTQPGVIVLRNQEAHGLSGARNTAVAVAKGEIIAFLDDDAFAQPEWLEFLTEAYEDSKISGVGGLAQPRWQTRRPRWLPEEFYWVVGCNYRGMPPSGAPVRNLLGGNMSFRREAFDLVPEGFRIDLGRSVDKRPLGCEETEFCIRLRERKPDVKLIMEHRAKVWHHVPGVRCQFSYFVARCYAEGLSKARVSASVGWKAGLSSERGYATRVLPLGAARGMADLFRGDIGGLRRAGAIVAGLCVTSGGYMAGVMGRNRQLPVVAALSTDDPPDTDDRRPAEEPRLGATWPPLGSWLLPASLALWAIGLSGAHVASLGSYGLLAAVGITFYAGLGLLVVSIGVELARAQISPLRLGLHAAALIMVLYGSAPLVYREGRYAWLYKTIGIVQYISAHGHVDRSIDIYQNWPGFFALAGWFDQVAGVSTPLDYAKWVQLVFELAALPLLHISYRSLALPVRQRWLAIFLYFGSNWIGQDYLSPQGLATVLSLGIVALVLRWMHAGNPSARGQEARGDMGRAGTPCSRPLVAGFALLFFIVTFVHELSPYILVTQLAALAVIGLLRPRWIVLIALVIAVAYLAPNFPYVYRHNGLFSSVGNFFGNLRPPVFSARPGASQAVIAHCELVLSIGVWALALIGAWCRRQSGQAVTGLLALTFAPILVLAIQAYGNEGILRAYLFSLPWAAALASSALLPTLDRGTLRAPLILACTVGLFLFSFFGDDASNVMSQAEVTTLLTFMEEARPGLVICALRDGPLSDTANYNEFPIAGVYGRGSIVGTGKAPPSVAEFLARTAEYATGGSKPAYVVISPVMLAYGKAYGGASPASFTALRDSLAQSRYWKEIVSNDGIVVFRITVAAAHMPRGAYNSKPAMGVP